MHRRRSLGTVAAALLCMALFVPAAFSQPATPGSKAVARYGQWAVVQKTTRYMIQGTGQTGKQTVCSAFFNAANASLEFEAKKGAGAWAVYVATKSWSYAPKRAALTIKSGGQSIRFKLAMYGGPMISAASHDLMAGQKIPVDRLKSLASRRQPITFYDNNNRKLVAFPNSGTDLTKALNHAIQCSTR